MRNRNRWLQVLAVGMAVMLMLGACGSADQGTKPEPAAPEPAVEETAEAGTPEESKPAGEAPEEETQEEAAAPKENPYDALDATFTYLSDGGQDFDFFTTYDEQPALRYWLSKEWDADGDGKSKKLELSVMVPPAGNERNQFNTLLATAEYPEVMSINHSTDKPSRLYEEGVALDLTDLVNEYMPNYKAYMENNETYGPLMYNDGRIIVLYQYNDAPDTPWCGWMYRRDWIVKYGKDAKGNSFSGGWNEDHSDWTDDVVFPSGNTTPIFISDWEWMFDIFETAMKEEGIEDGYVFQLYYPGYYQTGNLMSGFGGGSPNEYITADGKAKFGAAEDGMRAYLECMNTWYEKGWINSNFEENTSSQFFQIDAPVVYSGKCGCWMGLKAQLGYGMYLDNNPLLDNICVMGACEPTNDVYGSDDCKDVEPRVFLQFGNGPYGGVVITNKAEGKDLATLLTAMDYLYGQEGSLLRQYGLSDKMQAEVQNPFYIEHGMENGVWYEDEEDGHPVYRVDGRRELETGLSGALCMAHISFGRKPYKNVDLGRGPLMDRNLAEIARYTAVGSIPDILKNQLSGDDADNISGIKTQVNTYMEQIAGDFVTGRKDIEDDAVWQEYVNQINEFHPEQVEEIYNRILEKYGF